MARLRFHLVQKSESAIAEFVYALTELKDSLRKLRCTSETRKIKLPAISG